MTEDMLHFRAHKMRKMSTIHRKKHHNLNHYFFGMKTYDFLEHKESGLRDFLENDTILFEVRCVQMSEYKSVRNTIKYTHSKNADYWADCEIFCVFFYQKNENWPIER